MRVPWTSCVWQRGANNNGKIGHKIASFDVTGLTMASALISDYCRKPEFGASSLSFCACFSRKIGPRVPVSRCDLCTSRTDSIRIPTRQSSSRHAAHCQQEVVVECEAVGFVPKWISLTFFNTRPGSACSFLWVRTVALGLCSFSLRMKTAPLRF